MGAGGAGASRLRRHAGARNDSQLSPSQVLVQGLPSNACVLQLSPAGGRQAEGARKALFVGVVPVRWYGRNQAG